MDIGKLLKFAFIIKDSRFGISAAAVTVVLLLMTPASERAQDS